MGGSGEPLSTNLLIFYLHFFEKRISIFSSFTLKSGYKNMVLTSACLSIVWNTSWLVWLQSIILFDKLDGLGPVDNRPSTDQLQNFLTFFFYMWQVTHDWWHVP